MSDKNFTQRLARINQGLDPGADIVELVADGGSYRLAAGTGTLVSGTVAVATGLNTVTGFSCLLNSTSTGDSSSGTAEVEAVRVTAITTGSVTVAGIYHSATASVSLASVSGTSKFHWIAFGT